MKTVGKCSLLTVIRIKGTFVLQRKPPSTVCNRSISFDKILFKYRFGRIPVLCKICRFRCFFFLFISIIMKTVGKCSFLTVIRIKDIRFAVENHPQNLPFSVIFVLFISIILKTVGKCSLLTVISIKDIRFAVENPPQTSKDIRLQSENTPSKVCNRSNFLSTSYVLQRNKKKKFQKSINNSKNTYLFENSTIHR
ncbi:hypothetical protein AGLY_016806 [Aphis glycines]|uniref:Uncharacterized protein n=1 Tax=Aphis glycines TaxID=307491 RepID=A0A6G0SYR1_APHGL|nr:hypothetical protein AGLY_016806 [Aphis glycines]